MTVAGVDGCRAGWVVVTLPAREVRVIERLDDLPEVDVVGIDIPIGLPAQGQRASDVEARRRAGPRRSSVFPTPLACCLGAPTHAEAVRRARAAGGPAPSIQAFHLLPKIAEAMHVASARPLHEVHPELSFAAMAGAPMAHPKRTPAGRAEREAVLGIAAPRVRGAAADDVLDAFAVAWTAQRIADGTAERLGDPGEPPIWV